MTMAISDSLDFVPPELLLLPRLSSWPNSAHRFDKRSFCALRTAIACGRPLLLRGEPGIGKSQLARAAASYWKVPFLPFVVDERTERDDLFYTFDAVARIAQAQVTGLVVQHLTEQIDWRQLLHEKNFVRPSVLWWAYDWTSADRQSELFSTSRNLPLERPEAPEGWTPSVERPCGPVVLIDEIDKADSAVPNGLLECLGNHGFHSPPISGSIRLAEGAKPPLVILTTNEDRELPPAFLRRCLVLELTFPEDMSDAERFLIEDRARVFWGHEVVSDAICRQAAQMLLSERNLSHMDGVSLPGAAEYLDIIRVLVELCPGNDVAQLDALMKINEFALRKNLKEQR